MDVDNDRAEQDIDMDAEGTIGGEEDDMMVEDHPTADLDEHEGDEMYIEEEQHELADEMEAEPTPPVEGHERGFSFSHPAPTPATIPPALASPAIGYQSPFTPGSVQPLPLVSPGAGPSGVEEGAGVAIHGAGNEIISPEAHADLSAIQETGHDQGHGDTAPEHEIELEHQHEHQRAEEDEPLEEEYAEGHEDGHGDGEDPSAEHGEVLGGEYEGHEEEYEGEEEGYVEGEEGEEEYADAAEEHEQQSEHDGTDEPEAAEDAVAPGAVSANVAITQDHPEATDAAGTSTEGVIASADATTHISHHAEDATQESIEEEYHDEEGGLGDEADDDMDDYPHDIHSLPSIIINLPTLGSRALFSPSPEDQDLPVWLPGRVEALGEASLAKVWTAIKAELGREKLDQAGEMIITEKQMELKMGEADVNLQSITLLELAQVHYGCGLPAPMQLYISFEPHRFITRFNAIQQEVLAQMKALADEAVEVEVEFAGEIREGEGGEEAYFDGDEGEQHEAGEEQAWDQQSQPAEENAEIVTQETGVGRDSQDERAMRQDEYLRQKRERMEHAPAEDETRADKQSRVESDHPHADWAQSRLTQPLQISGSRIIAPRRSPHLPTESIAETQAETATEADAAVTLEVTVPPPAPATREATSVQDERNDDDVGSQAGGDKYADDDKDTVHNTNTGTDMSALEEDARVRHFPAEDSLAGDGLTPGQGEPHGAKDQDADEGVDFSYDAEDDNVDAPGSGVQTEDVVDAVDTIEVTATDQATLDAAQSPLVTPAVSVVAEETVATPDAKLAVVTEEIVDDEGYVEGGDTADGTDVDGIIDRAEAVVQDAAGVVREAREASVDAEGESALESAEISVEEAEKELEQAKEERAALETAETAAYDDDDDDEEDDGSGVFDSIADAAIERVESGDGDTEADADAVGEASPAATLEGDSEIVPTASDEVVVTSSVYETPLSVTETGEPDSAVAEAVSGLDDDDEDDTSLDPSTDTLSAAYLSPAAKRTYEHFAALERDGEPNPELDARLEQVDRYADLETATKKPRSE